MRSTEVLLLSMERAVRVQEEMLFTSVFSWALTQHEEYSGETEHKIEVVIAELYQEACMLVKCSTVALGHASIVVWR